MIKRLAAIATRIAGVVAVAVLAACGGALQGAPGPSPSPSNAPLQAVVATAISDQCAPCTLVGKDRRLPLGIVDGNGVPVADVKARAQVFSVSPGSAAPKALGPVVAAPYHGELLQGKGVYVIHQTFDTPGIYRVVVQASKGAVSTTTEANFTVVPTDPGIAVGSPAPATNNLLKSQVSDISTIDTGVPVDDMHYTTMATALAAHHAVVVFLGSPGFCQTKTCAPEVDVVKALETKYKAQGVDFVHVETYKGGRPDANKTINPEFDDWKLTSDPWVIVVDKHGKVAAKFDGPTTSDEIDPVVAEVAA
ncbi:MAG: TlpA family protein disulfide reductase [Candidatus Dormibacteria bacterium]